jgi:hypothetical protein
MLRLLCTLCAGAGEGMTAMIGLPTDRALSDDDECIQ